eukprot:Pompholyxophrys_punicea_v1_NODE_233_length_2631_cov_11.916149.p2 type:complete len:190 gc:universal NODE_233_length_2631_cov_11.916149:1884-2453(+)
MGSLVSLPEGEILSPQATSITGITEDMLRDAPSFLEVAQDFLDFVDQNQDSADDLHIFIAHNMTKFDGPKLRSHFQKNELLIPSNWYFVDSLYYCHSMAPILREKGTVSLQSLVKTFCPLYNFIGHRAEADCNALYEVLINITQNVFGKNVDVNERIANFFLSHINGVHEYETLPNFPHKFETTQDLKL